MKISANFLKKLIKEELRTVLYDDTLKSDIIRIFSSNIEPKNVKKLYKELSNIQIEPLEAIKMLSRNEVDPQFYQNACHMHNEMVKMLGVSDEMKIDAFADFPKPDSDAHRTPDEFFMRSPRLPSSTSQIDYRRGEKNYIQEKKK